MNALPPVAATVLVIGLALLLRLAFKRGCRIGRWAGVRKKSRELEALEQLTLTAHHSVHYLRCGDRRFLVVLHPGGCTVVDRFLLAGEIEHSQDAPKGPIACATSAA